MMPPLKKPSKPHNVDDYWSIAVDWTTVTESMDTLAEKRKIAEAEIAKWQAHLDEIDEVIPQGERWLEKYKNYQNEYMDYDDALALFVGWWQRGALSRNDVRLDDNELRYDLDGEMNREIYLKACRSTGTSWTKGFRDGSFNWSISEFLPEIYAYIVSHVRVIESE